MSDNKVKKWYSFGGFGASQDSIAVKRSVSAPNIPQDAPVNHVPKFTTISLTKSDYNSRYKKVFDRYYGKEFGEYEFAKLKKFLDSETAKSSNFWQDNDPEGFYLKQVKQLRRIRQEYKDGKIPADRMESIYKEIMHKTSDAKYQDGDERQYQSMISAIKQLQTEESSYLYLKRRIKSPINNKESKMLREDLEVLESAFFRYKFKDREPQGDPLLVVMAQDIPEVSKDHWGHIDFNSMRYSMNNGYNNFGASIIWPQDELNGSSPSLYRFKPRKNNGIQFGVVLDQSKVKFEQGRLIYSDVNGGYKAIVSDSGSLKDFAQKSWRQFHRQNHHRKAFNVRSDFQNSYAIMNHETRSLNGCVKSIMMDVSYEPYFNFGNTEEMLRYLQQNPKIGISFYDSKQPQGKQLKEYDNTKAQLLMKQLMINLHDADHDTYLTFKNIDTLNKKASSLSQKDQETSWQNNIRPRIGFNPRIGKEMQEAINQEHSNDFYAMKARRRGSPFDLRPHSLTFGDEEEYTLERHSHSPAREEEIAANKQFMQGLMQDEMSRGHAMVYGSGPETPDRSDSDSVAAEEEVKEITAQIVRAGVEAKKRRSLPTPPTTPNTTRSNKTPSSSNIPEKGPKFELNNGSEKNPAVIRKRRSLPPTPPGTPSASPELGQRARFRPISEVNNGKTVPQNQL